MASSSQLMSNYTLKGACSHKCSSQKHYRIQSSNGHYLSYPPTSVWIYGSFSQLPVPQTDVGKYHSTDSRTMETKIRSITVAVSGQRCEVAQIWTGHNMKDGNRLVQMANSHRHGYKSFEEFADKKVSHCFCKQVGTSWKQYKTET